MNKYNLILILSFMLLLTACCTNETINIDTAILINGYENNVEWDNNLLADTTVESVSIKIKQDSNYFYFNIKDNNTPHSGLDLYLANSDNEYWLFHISSAHNLKKFNDTIWTDIKWGAQENWSSNLIQMYVEDGQRKFNAPEIFEYQIDKKFFSPEFYILINFQRPVLKIPAETKNYNSSNWIKFNLN